MKKILPIPFLQKGLSALLLIGLALGSALAQTVTIPAANTNGTNAGDANYANNPFGCWFGFERTRLLYTAAEHGLSDRRITALGFFVNSIGSSPQNSAVTIRMKATTNTNLSASTYDAAILGTTAVYSGTITAASLIAGSWVTVNLTTPFDFSGSTNSIEIFIESNKITNYDANGQSKVFRWSDPGATRAQTWQQDFNPPIAGNGNLHSLRANIQITHTSLVAACSGTPVGGTSAAAPSSLSCPGLASSLSVTGFSPETGITLQWQQRFPSGTGVWTDISGATNQNVTINPIGTTDYRCNVTCTNSSQTTPSSVTTVNVNTTPVPLPYTEGFESLVTSMNQAFPLGCILNETVGGNLAFAWKGSNGGIGPGGAGSVLSARTGSKCVWAQWGFTGFMHLPTVAMTAGNTYRLTFWYKHAQSNNPGFDFSIRIGNAPQASAQTLTLATYTNQNNLTYSQATGDFVCPSSGNYNFSIRASNGGAPWELVVDDIQIVDLNNCSGTPNPGNTLSSLASVCASQGFDLSTSNLLSQNGLNFQWQSSTTGGAPWTNISGATLNSLSGQTQSAATWYRLSATCTNSSLTGTSTPVQVNQNNLLDCYCVPPNTNCSLNDKITNVTFSTLNNNSLCGTNGYNKFINTAPNVIVGSVQNLSVTVGSGAASGVVGVWFDWNQSGTFETSEYTALGVTPNNGGTVNTNITIPLTATLGNTRFRVRLKGEKTNINDLANNETCSNFGVYVYGETEDYIINITAQPPCSGTPVVGTATPASVGVCAGGLVGNLTYSGYSSGVTGLSYQWESSTDNTSWNPVGGATNLTYNPGTYPGGPLFYRLNITCANSGLTGNGASISVGINAPTIQAASLTFPTVSFTNFTVNWTNGNGTKRLVFLNSTNSFTNPSGTPGTPNTVWQNAGQQLVYDGTGNSVSVSGLTDGSTYYVRVYEYNECPIGTPTSWLYNNSTAFANPASVDLPAIFSYNFSEVAGTYTPIVGGTVLGAGQNLDEHVFGSATANAGPLASTTGLPIGFNFTYQGLNYDRFGVGINGFLKLGTGTFGIPNAYEDATNVINTTGADNNNLIAGFHSDLQTQTAVGSELRYQTLGNVGSRILVVQFKNFRLYPGLPSDLISFQIRLYETSNRIEVVYNALTTSSTLPVANAVVGLKGVGLAANPENISLRSTKVSATDLTEGNMGKSTNTSSATMSNGVSISNGTSPYLNPFNFNGLTYRWDPSTCKLLPPSPTTASSIGSVSAVLSWPAVAGAASYDVRYRLSNQDGTNLDSTTFSGWSTPINTALLSATISGLYPNSIYVFEVAARCGATRSEYSLTQSFKTLQATDDVSLIGITLNPDPETNSSCNTSKTVSAVIRNNGTATIPAGTSIPVSMQVTGAATQTISGSYTLLANLASNASVTGAIGTLNMATVGSYTFNGSTSWGSDQNPFNNALTTPVTKTYTKIAPAKGIYVQGFNNGNIWRAVQNAGTGVWANLANNLNFPSISPFEGNGTAFFNSFVFPTGTVSTLFSPCIELPDTCYVVRFRHTRDNAVSSALTEGTVLKVSTDGVSYFSLPLKNLSTGRDTTFARRFYGPASSPTWHEFEADLSAYSSQTITLAFEGTGNGGYNFAIDNVALIPVSANNVGITALISPEPFATCGSKTTTVTVRVRNFGCSPQSNIPVTVTVTGAVSPNPTVLNQIVAGPIAPGSSLDVNMGTINTPTTGSITLTGSTNLLNDEDNGNNSFGTINLQLKSAPTLTLSLSNANLVAGFGATINGTAGIQSPSAFFANNTNTTISDNVVGLLATNSSISVSGLPPAALASSIKSVVLSLQHPFVSELRLRLQAPDGSEVILKNEFTNITPNANMVNTVFTATASTPIASGSVPFNGSFLPQEAFSGLTGNANGTWKLYLADYYIQNSGTLLNWAISFDNGLSTASWTCPTCPTGFPVNFSAPIANVNFPSNPVGASFPVGSYTISLNATDYQGCTATNDTTVNFFTSNTWLGISNSPAGNNWSNPANWNAAPAPPTSTVAVTIPTGTPFPPNISGPASVGTVNLTGGAQIQFSAGTGLLNVAANWNGGNGTVTGPGTVTFNGTGTQTISGNTIFDNITISKASGSLNIAGTARVKGLVSISNATSGFSVAPTGRLILHSDASGTGRIGPIPAGAVITGQLTQERYVPYPTGSGGNWFFIGSPFSGRNFTEWGDNFKVVGLTSGFGAQGFPVLGSSQPERNTVFKLVESQHGVKLDTAQKRGWRAPGNENIFPGTGYRVFILKSSNPSGKFDNTGLLTSGLFNFPTLTRTVVSPCYPTVPTFNPTVCSNSDEGFNLLANPYPCPINWDATGGAWTKPANMNNAFFTWNNAAGGYRVYLASSPGVPLGSVSASSIANPNVIPSSQAFMVQLVSGSSGALSINENAKFTSNSGTFVRQASEDLSLIIRLGTDFENQPYEQALLRLKEEASDDFDLHLDAPGLETSLPGLLIGTENGPFLLANSVATGFETKSFPLKTDMKGASGNFRLSFHPNASLLAEYQIFIKDNKLQTLEQIGKNDIYSFTSDGVEELTERFELVFQKGVITNKPSASTGSSQIVVFPNPASGRNGFSVMVPDFINGKTQFVLMNAFGKIISDESININSKKVNFRWKNLASGVYHLSVQNSGIRYKVKVVITP